MPKLNFLIKFKPKKGSTSCLFHIIISSLFFWEKKIPLLYLCELILTINFCINQWWHFLRLILEHSMEMSTSGWFLKSYIITIKPWLVFPLHQKVFKKYMKMCIFSNLEPLIQAFVCRIISKKLSQIFYSSLICHFLSQF